MLIIKIIIASCLIFMVYNLFKALSILSKNDPNKPAMSKYIGHRVIWSVVMIMLILVAILTGVITPNPRPM